MIIAMPTENTQNSEVKILKNLFIIKSMFFSQ